MGFQAHLRFITFEGFDATGKTTQLNLLADYLRRRGFDVLSTREPGGTWLGERIRELVLGTDSSSPGPVTEALLFAAARADHVEKVIRPALAAGKVVLCDRYVDSTFAYQGYGLGVDLNWLEQLHETTTGGLMPALTLLFVLPPTRELRRDGQRDLIEGRKAEFGARVRAGYLRLAERYPDRYRVIVVRGDPKAVHRDTRRHVKGLFLQPLNRRETP